MRLQDIEGYTLITKDSINSVKCVRIISGEGSDKYNKYIQSLAKKILTISANRTDGHKNDEVGILARLDGRYETQPIYGYWDDKLETSIIDTTNNGRIKYAIKTSNNVQYYIKLSKRLNNKDYKSKISQIYNNIINKSNNYNIEFDNDRETILEYLSRMEYAPEDLVQKVSETVKELDLQFGE